MSDDLHMLNEYVGRWFEVKIGPKVGKYKIVALDPNYGKPIFITNTPLTWNNPVSLVYKLNKNINYKWLNKTTKTQIKI